MKTHLQAARELLSRVFVAILICAGGASSGFAQSHGSGNIGTGHQPLSATLADAGRAVAARQYTRAKHLFRQYLRSYPGDVTAQLGLSDAELALHEYEAAEWDYRRVVASQPQLWIAHKNLVIVEARLGRWDEFERERALLRIARERGAVGISARDSDLVDSFDVRAQHWLVREYFEPVGRSQARFNFERFSSAGRVEEYISLEPTAAANAALTPRDIRIGQQPTAQQKGEFSLNWYTRKAHGIISRYPTGEPAYERARTDVLRWLCRAK
jgi:hypothetical protein